MPGDALTVAGLHGKLPAHGDFVSRGLRQADAAAIDAGMAAMTVAARTEWGGAFAARWDTAQPWLYAGRTRSAVLIPSVDAAMRRFPLYVAARGGDLQALYDAAVEAIAEGLDADTLFGRVADMEPGDGPPEPPVMSEGPAGWFLPDPDQPALPWPESGMGIDWEGMA